MLEDSQFTYTYDANGNLTEKRSKATGDLTRYTYDAENQLIRVEQFTVGGGTGPVMTADYHYDALGRRIEKVVNGVSTQYVYDNEDIIVEFNATSPTPVLYIHGPGIDEPLAMFRSGQLHTYHADGLGSITTLTDGSGAPVRTYTYDSFGQMVDQTGTVPNPYTYTGREFDPETGLLYYRGRYYDPSTGRFLHEDPLGMPGIPSNQYVYAQNNAINLVDPSGFISDQRSIVDGTLQQNGSSSVFGGWSPNLLSSVAPVSSSLGPRRTREEEACPLLVSGGTGPGRAIGRGLEIADIARTLLEGGEAQARGLLHLLEADFRAFQQSGMHRFKSFENVDWERFDTTGKFDDALQNLLREANQ